MRCGTNQASSETQPLAVGEYGSFCRLSGGRYAGKSTAWRSKGSEAVQALKAGQIDCVIIDSQPAQKFVENNDDLKILDEPFEEEEYAICLKKGNDELLDKINGALKELKEDGTVDSIMDN